MKRSVFSAFAVFFILFLLLSLTACNKPEPALPEIMKIDPRTDSPTPKMPDPPSKEPTTPSEETEVPPHATEPEPKEKFPPYVGNEALYAEYPIVTLSKGGASLEIRYDRALAVEVALLFNLDNAKEVEYTDTPKDSLLLEVQDGPGTRSEAYLFVENGNTVLCWFKDKSESKNYKGFPGEITPMFVFEGTKDYEYLLSMIG